jgi:hypothetical protein
MRRLIVGLAAVVAAACTAQPAARQPIAEFLAFGDSGYRYEYLEADEGEGLTTHQLFIEDERLEWLEDKRPPAEFRAPPAHRRSDTGTYVAASGQDAVANAMRRYCEGPPACGFGVMLGDNIYPEGATLGADGHDDAERFRRVLLEPYAPLAANDPDFRIYVALGNHDWKTSREAAMAQVRYLSSTLPFYMDGIRYRVAPTGDPREVEIFVLDTHVMLSDHSILDDALTDDGRELDSGKIDAPEPWALPQDADEWGMAEWLERSLAESPARWKIVMGHHPIWSSAGSKFHQARMMRRLILPSLCRHADMYLAGHHHTVQHWQMDGIDYVVTGAGGASNYSLGDTTTANPARKFVASRPAFADVEVADGSITVRFVGIGGSATTTTVATGGGKTEPVVLYEYVRRRP